MIASGSRYDTIAWNRVEHNGSWGLLLAPFPDSGYKNALLEAVDFCIARAY